jgi:GNAT superfamily N-acetyltransferase
VAEVLSLTIAHADLLARFYERLYLHEFPHPDERESLENMLGYLRKRVEGWFGKNDYQILLAMEGETPVAGVIGDYLEAPDTAVVEFLVVSAERRGRGLGRKLLTAFEEAMKASARRAGQPLFAVVAEMNDPYRWTAHADSLDPFTRTAIWRAWGFGRVDFPYVQAALSSGQQPVTTLMLIAKLFGSTSAAPTLDARRVKLIVHEYMRWAMRIDEPKRNAEFAEMARFLDGKAERGQPIPVEPLGDYLGEPASLPFAVREARHGDAETLRQIAGVYERCFPPSATALQPGAFAETLASGRHEGKGYRYHLWGLADRETGRIAGMASYYSFRRVGFGGYLCLEGALTGRGLLKRLVSCIERQMIQDGFELQGWLIECDPQGRETIAKFEKVGFHQLAVTYHQPPLFDARDSEPTGPQLTLLYKGLGAGFGERPRLEVSVFIEAMTEILKFGYRIDDPGKSKEFQSLVAQTRQMRNGVIAWTS